MNLRITALVLLVGVSSCVPNAPVPSPAASPPSPTIEVEAIIPTPSSQRLQSQLDRATIDPGEVVVLLPPDAISAVLPEQAPQLMVTAAEADVLGMNPSVRVLGVSIHGDSRAYPIPFMSAREIVNDSIGGKPVAVTW